MAHLSDEDRANLVAYLDGELDDSASQALEARINLDPQLRAEADSFKRTWELLDYLPRPEPSPSFTNRTLERLALKDVGTLSDTQPMQRKARWPRVVGWAAAILLALGLGHVAGHWLLPPPAAHVQDAQELEEQLVQNFRVVRNKRLYDPIDDLEYLRALVELDVFGDDPDS